MCRGIDVFGDDTVHLIDAPGHLAGHTNLLVKAADTPNRTVYLAGDACHDRRLLRKEREISEWLDDAGHVCCIHVDKKAAEETLERIALLEGQGIEVIFAHDVDWEQDEGNKNRFWG